MPPAMHWYINALLAVIVGVMPVYFLVGREAAWAWIIGGTTLVIFGALAYIVFIDSRKRWPGVRAFDRFARVVTFYRN